LYASLLLKKVHPTHDITVVERNPQGATYGFGVVLSDRTLTSFREADYKTYADISEHQVLWNSIDVRYRDQTIRTGGHTFAGIARKTLLELLQRRCQELGVRVLFTQEIRDLSECADADLIIGADGVNSLVKTTYADAFKPSSQIGRLQYIWLGTHKLFDAFTFIFRQNEHGVFQVHAYPYDGTSSTVVIMCDESTWRRAELDAAGEAETIAYCERLFREDLGSHGLMSNNSKWINFVTLRHRTWHHGNAVLLGDAAHTVHFTIGSGTKLAMEDGIALANAFERHDSVEAALNDYELERRPIVDRFQEVAGESETYFQHIERYMDLDPKQFAFQLLTRGGTIDYLNLRLRDPYFVDAVDRWYARPDSEQLVVAPPPMLTPFQLRGLRLQNRVVLSSISACGGIDGCPSEGLASQLDAMAQGGAGLVLTEVVAVEPEGRITPDCAGMYLPEHEEAWARIVDQVHTRSSTKLVLELGHAGRRGSTRSRREGLDRSLPEGNWPLVAASPLPYTDASQTPREASQEDMKRLRHAFVQAARMALEVGFDMIQLNMAHGYLLAGFISPLTNLRTDEYGGRLENRMAFPLQVFDAVREIWPAERPISVAISATDWVPGGFEVDDAVSLARTLKARGCDLIEVLAGQTTADSKPVYGRAFLTPYSDRIRNEAGIPTMTTGNITTSSQINTILAAARADLCILHWTAPT
jgi:anthraniloyl-CoA monooxygenase